MRVTGPPLVLGLFGVCPDAADGDGADLPAGRRKATRPDDEEGELGRGSPPEGCGFAAGPVVSSLTQPWNWDPVEGLVDRDTTIERQPYHRVNPGLLRQRVPATSRDHNVFQGHGSDGHGPLGTSAHSQAFAASHRKRDQRSS